MNFPITPVSELPPAAPASPPAPPTPTSSKARVTLEVEIPESARTFADLVVKASSYRREARTLIAPPQVTLRELVVEAAPHAVPLAVSIAVSLFAGVGEGLASAMALWGGLRCALPARTKGQPLSGKAAEQIRDRATQAALGLDPTAAATMRHAAAAALEEARREYGLTPAAELVAQSLAFRGIEPGASDDTARRAAAAADALLPRAYATEVARTTLEDVSPFEALALIDRREALTNGNYNANSILSSAQKKASQALDAATEQEVRRLVARGATAS